MGEFQNGNKDRSYEITITKLFESTLQRYTGDAREFFCLYLFLKESLENIAEQHIKTAMEIIESGGQDEPHNFAEFLSRVESEETKNSLTSMRVCALIIILGDIHDLIFLGEPGSSGIVKSEGMVQAVSNCLVPVVDITGVRNLSNREKKQLARSLEVLPVAKKLKGLLEMHRLSFQKLQLQMTQKGSSFLSQLLQSTESERMQQLDRLFEEMTARKGVSVLDFAAGLIDAATQTESRSLAPPAEAQSAKEGNGDEESAELSQEEDNEPEDVKKWREVLYSSYEHIVLLESSEEFEDLFQYEYPSVKLLLKYISQSERYKKFQDAVQEVWKLDTDMERLKATDARDKYYQMIREHPEKYILYIWQERAEYHKVFSKNDVLLFDSHDESQVTYGDFVALFQRVEKKMTQIQVMEAICKPPPLEKLTENLEEILKIEELSKTLRAVGASLQSGQAFAYSHAVYDTLQDKLVNGVIVPLTQADVFRASNTLKIPDQLSDSLSKKISQFSGHASMWKTYLSGVVDEFDHSQKEAQQAFCKWVEGEASRKARKRTKGRDNAEKLVQYVSEGIPYFVFWCGIDDYENYRKVIGDAAFVSKLLDKKYEKTKFPKHLIVCLKKSFGAMRKDLSRYSKRKKIAEFSHLNKRGDSDLFRNVGSYLEGTLAVFKEVQAIKDVYEQASSQSRFRRGIFSGIIPRHFKEELDQASSGLQDLIEQLQAIQQLDIYEFLEKKGDWNQIKESPTLARGEMKKFNNRVREIVEEDLNSVSKGGKMLGSVTCFFNPDRAIGKMIFFIEQYRIALKNNKYYVAMIRAQEEIFQDLQELIEVVETASLKSYEDKDESASTGAARGQGILLDTLQGISEKINR